jgi:hypothetical protein
MRPAMIEESPESFIQRWRRYAATVELFARTEGSPLIECRFGPAIVQLLERTGPYKAHTGPAQVIVNAMVERLEPAAGHARSVETLGLSRIRASGEVVAVEPDAVVVECGAPLVVSLLDTAAPAPVPGSFVSFEAVPPLHGFLVTEQRGRGRVEESPDEAM